MDANIIPENWDELNARRCDLIQKKHLGGGLNHEEELEFKSLQELAGKIRDALTPPLPQALLEYYEQHKEED